MKMKWSNGVKRLSWSWIRTQWAFYVKG